MRSPVAEAAPDAFEALALRVFAWQYAHNEPYAAFCRRRGLTPDRVAHWTAIPAVPTQAFKALPLITAGGSGEAAGEAALFRTSGTTQGRERRGEHHVSDPALYHASLLPTFAAYLLPDGARQPMCSLVPPAADVPDSSLAHMVDRVMAACGVPGGGVYVDGAGRLDRAGLEARLAEHVAAGTPVCLLGTSLALLRWLEELDAAGRSFALPAGSRLMDTGGYKGNEREVSEAALRRTYGRVLGLPADHCVNEYGMTELLSQYYDDVLRRRVLGGAGPPAGPRPKAGPPWLRALAADPDTLAPLPPGEEGILRHVDLANLGSVAAVQTEDVGVVLADGRILLKGRLASAEPRGCSRAMDQLLDAARGT
ncbi:MAG: hypothetical protein WEB88_05700 [Gemmatimonadota bacterium]